jgi:hypothetical protein
MATDKIQHDHHHGHSLTHEHDEYGKHEHWFDHTHSHNHSDGGSNSHDKHEHLELVGPLFAHTEHHVTADALSSADDDLLGGDIEKVAKNSRALFWGE